MFVSTTYILKSFAYECTSIFFETVMGWINIHPNIYCRTLKKTYSEILGIPLTVIYEPEEIREALKKYKEKDFVLVDTAGRSHKSDELKKSDLDNLLKHLKNPDIFFSYQFNDGV